MVYVAMGVKLIIPVRNAAEAVSLLDQIRAHDLAVDRDFTWWWIPNRYNGYDDSTETEPRAEFEFCDPAWATYFQLKFGQYSK